MESTSWSWAAVEGRVRYDTLGYKMDTQCMSDLVQLNTVEDNSSGASGVVELVVRGPAVNVAMMTSCHGTWSFGIF